MRATALTARRSGACALALLALLAAGPAGRAIAADPIVQWGDAFQPFDAQRYDDNGIGLSAAVSADGRTALIGGPGEDEAGAAWAFVRVDGLWVQQGPELTPAGGVGAASFGGALALSADGDTALIGGSGDDGSRGAAWVFVRSGGRWTRQGAKLAPADPQPAGFGQSVALSADGDTALVGGGSEDGGAGAAWAFTRAGTTWSQHGGTLAAPATGPGAASGLSRFGSSVSLSGDGRRALVGGPQDAGGLGAAWAFRRASGGWSRDGAKLTGAGEVGQGHFGAGVALSADGGAALVGAPDDDTLAGAVWTFARGAAGWQQAGGKLTAPDAVGPSRFGASVAAGGTGRHAAVGGPGDAAGIGTAWYFDRVGDAWSPRGSKLATSSYWGGGIGSVVALSSDDATLLVGSPVDYYTGTVWTFAAAPAPRVVGSIGVDPGNPATTQSVSLGASLFYADAPAGTLTLRVYGPNPVDCQGPPAASDAFSIAPGFAGPSDFHLTLPTVGVYWAVIAYSGDERNWPVATTCGYVNFHAYVQPELTFAVGGPRVIGAPVSIEPTLSGGLMPTGTVEVKVYAPLDPTCSEAPEFAQTVALSDGRVPPFAFVPTTVGKLRVEVDYSGDADNFGAFNYCGDHLVEIGRAAPALALDASAPTTVGDTIGASARLVGGYRPTGPIAFSLFPPGDPSCRGRAVAIVHAPTAAGSATSGRFATTAAGTYRAIASYGGDDANDGAASPCGAARMEVRRRRPTLAVRGSASRRGHGTLSDLAELRDAFRPTGNVRFTLFGPGDARCRRRPAFTVLTPLDGVRASTGPLGPAAPGQYQFVVRYGGDANNEAVRTACGANALRVPRAASPERRNRARTRRR